MFELRRARPVLTFLPITSGYSLLYLIKLSDDIQKIRDFQSNHLYGNSLCPDLDHAAGDELITHARARVYKHSETRPNHAQTLYNNKEQSTNTFVSIWGTRYLTTMRFPKDLAPVP